MLRKSLFAVVLAAACGAAHAETLLIESVESAAVTRSERPARGETMAEVEARFGQPTRILAAVGDPPITRWEYPGFVVYFEGNRVIHAVVRR